MTALISINSFSNYPAAQGGLWTCVVASAVLRF